MPYRIPMNPKDLISKAATLTEALPYLQRFRGKTFVFKYGGHAMADLPLRESFLRDLILLKHIGIHPVVVHGGGPQIEDMLKKLGIESKYHNGLRVTDDETMDVVEMVLVGKVNSELVNQINKWGGQAVGLSGCDGSLIQAQRLPLQQHTDKKGVHHRVDLGSVGEVVKVNPDILSHLINKEMFIPIVSPLGISDDGESLNINADTVASEIAVALKAEKLILMTDVLGVLDSQGQVLSEVRVDAVESLITAGTIQGGMIPKVRGAVEAIEKGVGSVAIIDGRTQHAVLLEIFTDVGIGTLIHK